MMAGLYRSPLRVYLLLTVLSLVGILSAWRLPVSLFPNSSKAEIKLCIGITLAPSTFLRTYGNSIEEELRSIERGNLKVENVISEYSPERACYTVQFGWGSDPQTALLEVQAVSNTLQGRLPQDSRDRMWVRNNNQNGGFFALSFFSSERSLSDVYKILEPVLVPRLSRLSDAKEVELDNPQRRQLLIELKPEALAAFGLLPSDVARGVLSVLESYSGGSIVIDNGNLRIDFPRAVNSFDEFQALQIPTPKGQTVSLGDIAKLDLTVPTDATRIAKTSGNASVILFISPKPGGNIKAMSDGAMAGVIEVMKDMPKDIQFKELVNPSEFIQSAVDNVAKEVAVAAGLAVLILFLFVGNLRNVATAAIEIPLSIVLAFILMRLAGMNLNLISLGGLALSAGMNVDASVVVMENIFRHFEEVKGKVLDFEARLALVIQAVREVQFAVIASTIASLVVFLPLAFTSDLSYAILGDLAKAVVFSHGFSAIVALVLVPTIRLQLMKNGMTHEKPGLFEGPLQKIENAYVWALGRFLDLARLRYAAYAGLLILLAVLIIFVVPRLPREIIGKPDTDWLTLNVSTSGNTMIRQMETQAGDVENQALQKYGSEILYTFTQIYQPNGAFIMFRLRDRHQMESLWKRMETQFTNTPLLYYNLDSWNPAEMQIPDPPDFQVSVRGQNLDTMAETARDFSTELKERKLFPRVKSEPDSSVNESLRIRPRTELWPLLANQGLRLSLVDLADLTRVATTGEKITDLDLAGEKMDLFMRYPESYIGNSEDLEALPIGAGSRIIPLKAVASVVREEMRPSIRRENGRELFLISGRVAKGDEKKVDAAVVSATDLVHQWPSIMAERRAKKLAFDNAPLEHKAGSPSAKKVSLPAMVNDSVGKNAALEPNGPPPTIQIEDAKKDLTDAIHQLLLAVSLSIALIFLVMVFQFGSIMNSLLVLVAVPLGIIGVLLALFIFHSTLSLNSLLGVILLNGVAVANSIILVDFLHKKVREGFSPRVAAVLVAKVRLRPILMTSLTTGLGMLPIALGIGEGGKILQPLGIAVAGGLAFSMSTTLFLVPALQVGWMEFSSRFAKPAHGDSPQNA